MRPVSHGEWISEVTMRKDRSSTFNGECRLLVMCITEQVDGVMYAEDELRG